MIGRVPDVASHRPHDVAFDEEHGGEVRVAEAGGALGDGVQDRLHVGRRGGDRPQDLAGRGLLLQRLGQVARPLLDLLLQPLVRLAQPGRHRVERLAQRLDLVARLHLDLVVQLARADPLGPGLERPDRRDHPPRQRQAGDDREHQAEQQQADRPQHRGVERRERLVQRLLHQHGPAQRIHPLVGAQDLLALEAPRDQRPVLLAGPARLRDASPPGPAPTTRGRSSGAPG